MQQPSIRRPTTASGKHANYAAGMLGVEVAFGSLADCVESTVTGHVTIHKNGSKV